MYRITGYLCDSEICAVWPKKAVCRFIYVWLYMWCGYPTIDINNICAISVLLA